MRGPLLASLLVTAVLAGCLADGGDGDGGAVLPPAGDVRIEGGAVHMEVPVPVFLIGFSGGLEARLQEALAPMTLRPATFLQSSAALNPTARFEVHAPDASWQAAFDAFLKTAIHPGNAGLTGFGGAVLDGNAIEDHLDLHLGEIAEVPAGITSLVVLDPGLRGHAYHYTGNVGWREPVRSFGERHDLLVWDPHAEPDPWVGTAAPHHVPADAPSADAIAEWAKRAASIRALHMPIWPPTTLPCHAVTVLLAVRGTTVTPQALGLQRWDEALDVDRMRETFQNLTGDPVHVDLVVKHLPEDDPPLEAVTRENNARAVTQTYLDLEFDAYHVPHDGCEAYLSLIVYGDLADQRTSSNGNAIMMTGSGHRVSTSLIAENVRVMSEVIGYNGVWDESTSFERSGPGADPLEWFNWVATHETGHLFSLPHPDYATGSGAVSDPAFSSTWNVMSYQMRRIVTDTSAVDAHNMQRNQAAYALLGASDAGVPAEALDAALEAMGRYQWKEATLLATDPAASDDR